VLDAEGELEGSKGVAGEEVGADAVGNAAEVLTLESNKNGPSFNEGTIGLTRLWPSATFDGRGALGMRGARDGNEGDAEQRKMTEVHG
jgi:hypothetical protein